MPQVPTAKPQPKRNGRFEARTADGGLVSHSSAMFQRKPGGRTAHSPRLSVSAVEISTRSALRPHPAPGTEPRALASGRHAAWSRPLANARGSVLSSWYAQNRLFLWEIAMPSTFVSHTHGNRPVCLRRAKGVYH